MSPRFLQNVLRSLADAGTTAGDGDLLRQFVAERNEAAFAELVRRHGRLVWSVCRHLTRSDVDADDAFQATFLVLLQNAGKIRDAARLSAWLHGVAARVCAKTRQAGKRRTSREQARATPEGNGFVVPDSAWDRALTAVHEEAARLPDRLRMPFVLCCLEGKGVTEAAAELGWKVGTFSGRLTRAKDAVLARLDARGLALGAVAGVGLGLPPAAALAKAAALARAGVVVSGSILQLTQGAIGMSMKSVKLLAAIVTLTCGLGLGVGAGWLGTAAGQTAPKGAASKSDSPPDSQAETKRLVAELDRLVEAAAQTDRPKDATAQAQQEKLLDDLAALLGRPEKAEMYAAKTKKWEYDFVVVSDMSQAKFVEFLQDRENRGWEYNGQTTLRHDGKPTGIWIFRRPAQGVANQLTPGQRSGRYDQVLNEYYRAVRGESVPANDAKAIEAEIERLQAQLQTLRGKIGRTTISKSELPLPPEELAPLLQKLADRHFTAGSVKVTASPSGIVVEGNAHVRAWALGVVNKLAEK